MDELLKYSFNDPPGQKAIRDKSTSTRGIC